MPLDDQLVEVVVVRQPVGPGQSEPFGKHVEELGELEPRMSAWRHAPASPRYSGVIARIEVPELFSSKKFDLI
ncbi:MAG TPA: hypothetical protein VFV67_03330 [Actinophytocola sp.]|uniref:hypothetical protein n=1 Tax=Actinophytocola sp. TaxID=1872138 RepID=UPI002DBAF4EB|nr:hypothetical protein [Actinophytocola sp.]HEU5469659.1 hypothetical protein [Actinophytocola sp.]